MEFAEVMEDHSQALQEVQMIGDGALDVYSL